MAGSAPMIVRYQRVGGYCSMCGVDGNLRYREMNARGVLFCWSCKAEWSVIPPDPEPERYSRLETLLGAAAIVHGLEADEAPGRKSKDPAEAGPSLGSSRGRVRLCSQSAPAGD